MFDIAQFNELKASGKLPSPKGPALKVIELCQRDNATLSEIVGVLQTDPATVGRLLKLANSSSFARSRPVVALTPDVLMSLGIQTVRQVTLAISLLTGNRSGQCKSFDYDLFWSRSVATGVAMQLIGATTRLAPPAELFSVGLLSNIGRLALATLHPDIYRDLLADAGNQYFAGLSNQEAEVLGYDHLEISAAMMRDWGLPKLFVDAELFHEEPDKSGFEIGSRAERLVASLHLASRFVELFFSAEENRANQFAELQALALKLGISEAEFVALGNQLLREWKEWSALLEIPIDQMPEISTFAAYAATSPAGSEKQTEHLSILVVDDDLTLCLILKKLLTAIGHSVLIAHDGREGLAQALQHKPQLVITDLLMPHRDGIHLIQNLRQSVLGRFVYIMVLTVLGDDEKGNKAFDAGADDYLVKPVDANKLYARLKAGQRVIHEQISQRLEQEVLQQRLKLLAVATQHAQEASMTDVVPGLFSKRYALERLKQAWSETERSNQPLSILMLEIVGIEMANTSGTAEMIIVVMSRLAEIMKTFSRASDIPCRFNSAELMLITPGTSLDGAAKLAKRILSAFDLQRLETGWKDFPLKVRIGIAEKKPDRENIEVLLQDAQKNMELQK